jgi:uncharacterized protein (DUF433 family)
MIRAHFFRSSRAMPLTPAHTEAVEAPTSDRIVKTPGTCGGKARIAGHRIRVLDIVGWHEHRGMSPDEIVTQFPSLTVADVHTALAYYFDHLEEIRAEMQEERKLVEESRRSNPSLLEAKLKRSHLHARPATRLDEPPEWPSGSTWTRTSRPA